MVKMEKMEKMDKKVVKMEKIIVTIPGYSGYPHQTLSAVRPRSSGNWTLQLSAHECTSIWTMN